MTKTTTTELMAGYLAAFRSCNTMSDPPHIYHAGGWYTFKSPGTPPRRYRRREVEAMRDRLRERAGTTT